MTSAGLDVERSRFAVLTSALRSRRTVSVVLLSFSSGLPFGLVWYAIPDWMRTTGVDIRIVGLLTLAQAPWAFKVLWSPLMDRFVPPFWGRRRGWMAIAQIALIVCGLLLAGVGNHPDAIWVVGALALATALASASQDIAYDAYTVDVLRPEEQGAAVGARAAMYRAAMAVSGGAAISLASRWGWPAVNLLLASVYVPLLVLTWRAPDPEVPVPPPATLRETVWQPFLTVFARPRALEILAFVVLYKLADQLAQALTLPFLIDMGYSADQRGLALATVGLAMTMAGALLGGWLTTLAGLGNGLWLCGLLQIFSNAGYVLLAQADRPSLPLMFTATSVDLFTSGLGTGAFSVLLLRLTDKRFSATQYAFFSSLFAIPRLLAGPVSGFVVHAVGWPSFYVLTMVAGIPGLIMLARFIPIGVREPVLDWNEATPTRSMLPPSALIVRGAAGAIVAGGVAVTVVAAIAMFTRSSDGTALPFGAAVSALFRPDDAASWIQLLGVGSFAAGGGVFTAATLAVRGANRSTRGGALEAERQ